MYNESKCLTPPHSNYTLYIILYPKTRHRGSELRVNIVALFLDDAAPPDGRLQAVSFEIFYIYLFCTRPMREQQLHVGHGNALHGIKVTRIRIPVAGHQFVKQQSVDILCAKRMQDFREILHIQRPALVNDALMDARQVPAFNKAVETVEQSRLAERLRQGIEIFVICEITSCQGRALSKRPFP